MFRQSLFAVLCLCCCRLSGQDLAVPPVQFPEDVGEVVVQFRSVKAKDKDGNDIRVNTFGAVFEVLDKQGKRLVGDAGQRQLNDEQVRAMLGSETAAMAAVFDGQVLKLKAHVVALKKAILNAAKLEPEPAVLKSRGN